MNRSHRYGAFFILPDIDPDRAIALGIKWLVEQPAGRLILLHAKKMIDNNRQLRRAADEYGIRYEAPRTVARSSNWSGGAILAPWASAGVIRCIDDDLANRVTAVCIIGWRRDDPNHAAWIRARHALDLATGAALWTPSEDIVGDPVIRIALDHAERFVNHNNALVQSRRQGIPRADSPGTRPRWASFRPRRCRRLCDGDRMDRGGGQANPGIRAARSRREELPPRVGHRAEAWRLQTVGSRVHWANLEFS